MADALFQLDGRVAVVTGASDGLGSHFAQTLSKAGAIVLLGARRESKLESLVRSITASGKSAHCHALDVTKQARENAHVPRNLRVSPLIDP